MDTEQNWKNLIRIKMISQLLLILILTCHCSNGIYSLIVTDACFTSKNCDTDPATHQPAPLTIMYRNQPTTHPDFLIDQPIMESWSEINNITIVLRRPDPEPLRYILPDLLASSVGPDILMWQSITPFVDNCYDLTDISVRGNWSTRYSPRLMELMTVNGRVLGIPDRYNFWGIWYSKPLFQQLQLVPPNTWDEFLSVCQAIKTYSATTTTTMVSPIGLTDGDKWQGMTWWEMIAVRIGGGSWWRKFLRGEIDAVIDPIHIESWRKISELIDRGFFPPPNTTAMETGTFLNTVIDWLSGKHAMILSWGITRSFPSNLGLNNDDYDFFPFPTINPNLLPSEVSEFSGFTVWAINKDAKQLAGALKYVELLTTDEYNLKFVGNLNGDAPGLTAIRSLITDSILQRGFNLVDGAANIFTFIDVVLPAWAKVAKPIMSKFFTGKLTTAQLLEGFENTRQEVLLQRVVQPTFSLGTTTAGGDKLKISTNTDNATIFYSLDDEEYFYPYSDSILLDLSSGKNYRVRAYARHELMRDSLTVEWHYDGKIIFHAGDILQWRFSAGIGLTLGIIISLLISWGLLVCIDIALRERGKADWWIFFGMLAFGVGSWGVMIMITTSMQFVLGEGLLVPKFSPSLYVPSIFLTMSMSMAGYFLISRNWLNRSKQITPSKYAIDSSLGTMAAENEKLVGEKCCGAERRERMGKILQVHLVPIISSLMVVVGFMLTEIVISRSINLVNSTMSQNATDVWIPVVAIFTGWPLMFGAMMIYMPRRAVHPILRVILFCSLTSASLLSVYFISSSWSTWVWTSLSGSLSAGMVMATEGDIANLVLSYGLIGVAAVFLPGIIIIPFAMNGTIYAFEHMTRNLNNKIDTLKSELDAMTNQFRALETRSLLLSSFNPNGKPSQCDMVHFAKYLGKLPLPPPPPPPAAAAAPITGLGLGLGGGADTIVKEEKTQGKLPDPSIDEWIRDDFSRAILMQHASHKHDDENLYFIMATQYFKSLPMITDDEKLFSWRMAKSIHDRFITGDCEINMSSSMSSAITDRLAATATLPTTENLKNIFDSALKEVKKLVMGNTVADMRDNNKPKFRMARNFILASKSSLTLSSSVFHLVDGGSGGGSGGGGGSMNISIDKHPPPKHPDSPISNAVVKFSTN